MSKPVKKDRLPPGDGGRTHACEARRRWVQNCARLRPDGLVECDTIWKQGWLALLKQIQQAEPDKTKRNEIVASIRPKTSTGTGSERRSTIVRRVRVVHFTPTANRRPLPDLPPGASALGPADILYVKFVAGHLEPSCDLRPRDFRGSARSSFAPRSVSREEPRFVQVFACIRCRRRGLLHELKMVKVDSKEDAQSLAVFRAPASVATKSSRPTDMSTHDEGSSDFTPTTRTSRWSDELFERYREFQSFIARPSRESWSAAAG